jgi:hypothetical protein
MPPKHVISEGNNQESRIIFLNSTAFVLFSGVNLRSCNSANMKAK